MIMKDSIALGVWACAIIGMILIVIYSINNNYELQNNLIHEYENNLVKNMQDMNNDYVENIKKIEAPVNLFVEIKEK